MRGPARIVLPLILLAGLVSCSSAPSSLPSASGQSAPPRDTVSRANARELMSSLLLLALASAGHQARFESTYFECMSRAGFDVPLSVRPAPGDAQPPDIRSLDEKSRDEVAKFAYLSSSGGVEKEDDPLGKWISSLPADAQQRYNVADVGSGTKTRTINIGGLSTTFSLEGCNYEALRAEWGDVDEFYSLTNEANAARLHLQDLVGTDKDFLASKSRWKACLSKAGYAATEDPGSMPRNSIDRSNAQVALADYDCRQSSGLAAARQEALVAAVSSDLGRLTDLSTRIRKFVNS